MSVIEDSGGAKPRRCGKCRQPVCGHPGPIGDKCTAMNDTGAEGNSSLPETNMLEKQSFILEEILRELTLLNINFGSANQPMTSHNVQIPSGSSSDVSTSLYLPPPMRTSCRNVIADIVRRNVILVATRIGAHQQRNVVDVTIMEYLIRGCHIDGGTTISIFARQSEDTELSITG